MGFAIATKLLPLMFLPFFIRRLGLFSSVFLSNIGSSIGLYFQRFEFNGSIYYLFRWLGQQVSGYNQIRLLGPLLHRYPLVWSFMILLTYVNYINPVFVENLWVVGLEYVVVGIFVWRERGNII